MSVDDIRALFNGALVHHQNGQLAEAEAAYQQIMRAAPNDYPSRCMLGRLRIEQGRYAEAEKILQGAIRINSQAPPALSFCGVALLRQNRFAEATVLFERAIAVAAEEPGLHRNLGDALRGQMRLAEALDCYDRALALNPRAPEVLESRAETLAALGRPAEGLQSVEAALALEPGLVPALTTRAGLLKALGRHDEAITAYDAVLYQRPQDALALEQRAELLMQMQRPDLAVADLDAVLRLDPENTYLLILRGTALAQQRRYEQAIASYDAAIRIDASQPEPFFNRGLALEELGDPLTAIDSYDRALALRPDYIAALNNRSGALSLLRRHAEARRDLERILALEPDHIYAYGGLAHCLQHACDWTERDAVEAGLRERVLAGKVEIPPGALLAYIDDPALQLACARHYAALNLPQPTPWKGPPRPHDRIRIAYLSADLHEHPTARLAAELFERHDRTRFEIFALSFGPDDGSAMRARLEAAFEHFHDVRGLGDAALDALMRELEIDIAVDLKGYTQDARPKLFAARPAPLQVNYLGFPGTLGADCYDYILADAIVAPMALQPHFSERIVHLPGCYQPNDAARTAPETTLSRADAGLPDAGFVFCCFNNNYKIAPPVFDVWTRLLLAVEGSVLWLLEDSREAAGNLRAEAARRGVDPQRLVFAPRVSPLDHLARHRLADVLLDTLPYGAHTTASDALWMGVPVVTCLGKAFAGRVCASLCHAVGLEELIAGDLTQYEAVALDLARNPDRLARIRAELQAGRMRHPLFDADACRRGVEAAFEIMWANHLDGRPPEAFAVTLSDR